MTHECEDCGGRVASKNTAGHYRDRCRACRHREAARNRVEAHCRRCDWPNCPVK